MSTTSSSGTLWTLRHARNGELQRLGDIAVAAKGYWGYSPELMQLWENELRIQEGDLRRLQVWVAEAERATAWYGALASSLQEECEDAVFADAAQLDGTARRAVRALATPGVNPRVWSLEACWVDPEHIGQGLGRLLVRHFLARMEEDGYPWATVVSDPHAEGFYHHMGFRRLGMVPSRPAGRELPLMVLARS